MPFDPIHDFLLTFHSKHGPILHRFRDRWRFQSKIAKFSYLRMYFTTALMGFPWIGMRGQKLE